MHSPDFKDTVKLAVYYRQCAEYLTPNINSNILKFKTGQKYIKRILTKFKLGMYKI